MAYQTYTTEALVCGSRDSNTSDKSYLLFTKDAGMLWATARSVREEKSKQRFALQDFSLVRVSLVKGKAGWRVGSVEAIGNPFMKARSRGERAFIKRVVTLLRRYVQGEEPVTALSSDVAAVLQDEQLWQDPDRTYLLFEARTLNWLGYLSQTPVTEAFFTELDFVQAQALADSAVIEALEADIKHAHHMSQL